MAILMINIPIIVLHLLPNPFRAHKTHEKTVKFLFYMFNIPAFAMNCIDIEFFKFTNKRSTADLFSMMGYGNDVENLIPTFLRDYWFTILIFILLIVFTEFLYRKTQRKIITLKTGKRYYFIQSILMLIFAALFIVLGRGGFQLRPAGIISASKYVNPKNISIVLNTPFTLIKTWGKDQLTLKNYYSKNELTELYSPVKHFKNNKGITKKENVIIIILESFSQEYIGYLNGTGKTYTPFLDSLFENSLVFKNAFANGTRSIEALPSILAGIPSLMSSSYTSSPYSGNEINTLANLLHNEGYQTSFFHGSTNGSMAFDRFCAISGIEKYHGRSEYNNDEHYNGTWGIHDEEFLLYFSDQLDNHQQPFFSSVFTISSHHPFIIPEKHKGKFDGPTEMHKTIRYSDFALQQFFKKAQQSNWFDNTLFVITADHTFHSPHPYYNSKVGKYDIPIAFYKNDSTLLGLEDDLTQHIDIFPSIMDLLGYNKPFYAFGNSVFDENPNNNFWISFLDDIIQYAKDDYVLQFGDEKSLHLYQYDSDSLLRKDLITKEIALKKKMETHLKALLQAYNNDLINNKTIIKPPE